MESNQMGSFGERLRFIREGLGKSHQKMALELGYKNHSGYSKIESGAVTPSMSIYDELAKKYKVRMSWLAFGQGTPYMTDEEYNELMKKYPNHKVTKVPPTNNIWADDDLAENLLSDQFTPSVKVPAQTDFKLSLLKTLKNIEQQMDVLRKQIEDL